MAELITAPTRVSTVVVVDDHRTFADLLSFALSAEPGLDCVGVAHTATQGIELARRLRPDIVVMDVQMPEVDGFTATRRLRDLLPDTAVAIVTALHSPDGVARAAQAGASAFIPKDGSLDEMLSVLKQIRTGNMVVAPSTFARQVPSPRRPAGPAVPALTRRELDVLHCLSGGLSPKVAAKELGITVHTFRGYSKSLYAKLGVRSQLEMVVRARQLGLLTQRGTGG